MTEDEIESNLQSMSLLERTSILRDAFEIRMEHIANGSRDESTFGRLSDEQMRQMRMSSIREALSSRQPK